MNSKAPLALLSVTLLATPSLAQCGLEHSSLRPKNESAHDLFGWSVAIWGNAVIVGANGDDEYAIDAGSAGIFNAATGQQTAVLYPADATFNALFGVSVAIDDSMAIVGANGKNDFGFRSGAAYLFDTATGAQVAKLLPNDGAGYDDFGISVAISGDLALVGAMGDDDLGNGSGSAYLFDTTTGQQVAKLLPNDGSNFNFFGASVGLSGNTAIIGAMGGLPDTFPGAVYLFNATTGTQIAKLLPNDPTPGMRFGRSVAIRGNTAIIGAPDYGAPTPGSGSAYLFDITTGLQIAKLQPSDGAVDDLFGLSTAISHNTAIVGAMWHTEPGAESGSAYVFDTTTGQQIKKLLPSDGKGGDWFGFSVAIEGDIAAVGAPYHNEVGDLSGSAYLFKGIFQSTNYCIATNNSLGVPVDITACGVNSLAANNLLLTAGPIPDNLNLFFFGKERVQNPLGNGYLCIGSGVTRLSPASIMNPGNVGLRTVDLAGEIGVPGTYNFQCWYRDSAAGGAGFNLSNAISITFVP